MCDPITLTALGMAASAGGGLWSRSDQLNNAQREAAARNSVLSSAIGNLNQIYSNTNAPAFSSAVAGLPTDASLKGAQDARTGAILGNVKAPSGGLTPATPGAPPALAADRAKQMAGAMNFVQNQGTATGKLGGFGDSWFNSGLNEQDAARKIGVGNSFANETKSLIGPEQDLAGAAAYKTPSPWPGLLQGAGGLLGAASGGSAGKSIGSLFNNLQLGTPFMPSGGFGMF